MTVSIEQRLDLLESKEAILALKYAYCAACDNNYDPQAIAALFTNDGIGDYAENDKRIGPAAIAKSFTETHVGIPFAAHLVINPQITINGDEAHGSWWLLMPATRMVEGAPVAYWLVGRYEDTYRRVNGAWRIGVLNFRENFWAPHLEGWAAMSMKK